MRIRALTFLAFFGASLSAAGCAPADETEAEAEGGETTAREATESPATAGPATEPDALWSHLQTESYRDWTLWPGTTEKYTGTDPHGALLTTYLNETAEGALSGDAGEMPPGAIIVKENYMPDSTLAAITTMYKVEEYNPDAGNWYWVKYLPDGSVDNDGAAAGMVPGCIQCHSARADNDYIYTGTLGGGM